jgi:diaminobutyrate-2-oxoglutarate transaminase
MAMGTGIATLKAIRDQNLAQNAQERGDFLQAELKKMAEEFPCIGNVRGRGLMLGIEIVDESQPPDHMGSLPADAKLAAAIQTACFNNQLLLEKGGRNGTVIRLLCPLIITQEECEEVLVRFKRAVAQALVAVRGA